MEKDDQQVKIQLPENLVRAAKVAAVIRGTTFSHLTAEALRAFIANSPPTVPDGDDDAD